ERTATVVVNAYVGPPMTRHLGTLARAAAGGLQVMQSSGGLVGARTAATEPVRTILSGPAAGVVGAAAAARLARVGRIVTLDMGGTSTDVSLVDGPLAYRTEATIDGLPVRVPALDIHTVGAGGGSLARLDAGGAPRVGPESAGAVPGPACYGRGNEPNGTDAHGVPGALIETELHGCAPSALPCRPWPADFAASGGWRSPRSARKGSRGRVSSAASTSVMRGRATRSRSATARAGALRSTRAMRRCSHTPIRGVPSRSSPCGCGHGPVAARCLANRRRGAGPAWRRSPSGASRSVRARRRRRATGGFSSRPGGPP